MARVGFNVHLRYGGRGEIGSELSAGVSLSEAFVRAACGLQWIAVMQRIAADWARPPGAACQLVRSGKEKPAEPRRLMPSEEVAGAVRARVWNGCTVPGTVPT